MPFESASLGLPVPVGQITAQLKALWADGDHRTRASLLNLAVYCQTTASFDENTALISRFVRNHACRAILLGDIPAAHAPSVSGWIQAHCHLTKAGAQEICSEQITLLAEGLPQVAVANLLLSHLDYDLPLNLWWQGPLPQSPDSPIWHRVNRLIFDSRNWSDPAEEIRRLNLLRAHSGARLHLADLNWTRSLSLRQAIAVSFDAPALLGAIPHLTRLEIQHGSGARLTALLLAAWFAAQFQWRAAGAQDGDLLFQSPSGSTIRCRLTPSQNEEISRVVIGSDDCTLSIEHENGSPLLNAVRKDVQGSTVSHFTAGNRDLQSLLSEEMIPGVKHRVYLKALSVLPSLV
jgi:glucose-6-phosphate dehydrogenase assembly protein OpcA